MYSPQHLSPVLKSCGAISESGIEQFRAVVGGPSFWGKPCGTASRGERACQSKGRITVHRLLIRLLRFLAPAIFVMSTLPVHAQQPAVQSSDFRVVTADGVSIHVHRKIGPAPNKIPVLLIHGTWGDGRTSDFPDRSVMDHLAVRGYDVYALDLRGMGTSDHPASYFTIDILNRVNEVPAVATYIVTTTGRAPVVMGWSQGGVITGLLAASAPQLVAGVGFFSVPQDGFFVPPPFLPLLQTLLTHGVDP